MRITKSILKNKKLIYHSIVTFLTIVFSVFFLDYSEVDILNQKGLKIINYDDGETIGNSESELSIKKDSISLRYTLGEKAPYPFAGIEVEPLKEIDLSGKDFLVLELKVKQKGRMHIFFTTKTHSELNQKFMLALDCSPEQVRYKLSFEDFITPTWWYKNNKVTELEYKDYDLSRVVGFYIENDVWVQKRVEHSFAVTSLKSLSNNAPIYFWCSMCSFLLNLVGIIGFRLTTKKKVEVNYKAIDYEEKEVVESDLLVVVDYINSNYQNPELTLKLIRNVLKIPENKISSLIKEEFSMSYKDYVHSIRINEAKRFLSTTKMNINEVADIVGYGSISTFNRVFKEKEGLTPSDFVEGLSI